MAQFRTWIGTLNNPSDHYLDVDPSEYIEGWYSKASAAFATGQVEKGEEGTVHIQFFLHFKDKKRVGGLKSHCKYAHFQGVKVNNGADTYCNKEETRVDGPWSYGIRPAQNNKKGDKARKNKELLEMGPDKAMLEGHVLVGRQYLDLVKATEIYHLRTAQHFQTEDTRGVWLWGPPGTGKTHYARENYPDAYIKGQSKWFDGYNGQKYIILDDLDSDCLAHYLKIWMDKWPSRGEFKGGTTTLQHEKFIVTSNFSIEDLFARYPQDTISAIKRRCEIHHFLDPFKAIAKAGGPVDRSGSED